MTEQQEAFNQDEMGGVDPATSARLRSYVERVERLQEEIDALKADIKEVKAEAKSDGFDMKGLNQILKIRKMNQNDRAELEAITETYMIALGME